MTFQDSALPHYFLPHHVTEVTNWYTALCCSWGCPCTIPCYRCLFTRPRGLYRFSALVGNVICRCHLFKAIFQCWSWDSIATVHASAGAYSPMPLCHTSSPHCAPGAYHTVRPDISPGRAKKAAKQGLQRLSVCYCDLQSTRLNDVSPEVGVGVQWQVSQEWAHEGETHYTACGICDEPFNSLQDVLQLYMTH